jgi:hypothetical protein
MSDLLDYIFIDSVPNFAASSIAVWLIKVEFWLCNIFSKCQSLQSRVYYKLSAAINPYRGSKLDIFSDSPMNHCFHSSRWGVFFPHRDLLLLYKFCKTETWLVYKGYHLIK